MPDLPQVPERPGAAKLTYIPYKLIYEMVMTAIGMAEAQTPEQRGYASGGFEQEITLIARYASDILEVLAQQLPLPDLEPLVEALVAMQLGDAGSQLTAFEALLATLQSDDAPLIFDGAEYASMHYGLVVEISRIIVNMAATSSPDEWAAYDLLLRERVSVIVAASQEIFIALLASCPDERLPLQFTSAALSFERAGSDCRFIVMNQLLKALAWHDSSMPPPRISRDHHGNVIGAHFGDVLGQSR